MRFDPKNGQFADSAREEEGTFTAIIALASDGSDGVAKWAKHTHLCDTHASLVMSDQVKLSSQVS